MCPKLLIYVTIPMKTLQIIPKLGSQTLVLMFLHELKLNTRALKTYSVRGKIPKKYYATIIARIS